MRITSVATDGRPPRSAEAIVWAMAFTAFAATTLSTSLSPLLIAISNAFGISESAAGQLGTICRIAMTISAIVSAPWMSRFSQRIWLRAELGLLMLSVVIAALAPSFAFMVVAQIVLGVGAGALLANCFTAASEAVSDKRRSARAVGIVASGTTVAVMAGLPIIAFLEAHFGWRWALASVLVPLGLSLAGTTLLPATRAGSRRDGVASEREQGQRFSARALARDDRVTLAIVLATGSLFVAYLGWLTYYSAYVERDFSGGAGRIGALFLVGGLAELVGNFGAPAVSHRAPVRQVALLGMAGMAVALLGSGALFGSIGGLFVGIALLHLCTSFAYVGLNTLLVQRPARIRGTVMALSSAAVGLGGALGALIGGAVLAVTDGYVPVFHVLGVLTALAAIGLALVFRAAGGSGIVEHGAPQWSE